VKPTVLAAGAVEAGYTGSHCVINTDFPAQWSLFIEN